MSKTLVRWIARALVAGCLVVGTVVVGAGTSAADNSAPTPPPIPISGANGTSWTGG